MVEIERKEPGTKRKDYLTVVINSNKQSLKTINKELKTVNYLT
ncbi:hypothetical protein SAMN04488027_10914 [Psychroflexus sediminis]|uniref:Uncharacterized protein n=1 Tax=Psychroflexus sediminis TaxID=470826 RepID=A0A1G7XMK1_9FLAO|nr:hypothetical protein SAMN04488027_10914 [Psychroflexus sediminis]